MASQQPPPPPARPWFRLASIRPPPAAPTSNPQPDPVLAPARPVIRPAFSQPYRPQEPAPPPVTAPPRPPPPRALPELTSTTRSPPRSSPPPPQPPLPRSSPPPPPPQPPLPRSSPPPPQPPLPRFSPPPPRSSPPPPTTPTSPVIKASPPPKVSSPSFKLPTIFFPSPPPPPVQITTTAARSPNPSSSPSPSPNIRHISHPPSPLTLPPAQLSTIEPQIKIPQEPEQKTVLVQQITEKSKSTNSTSSNNTQHKYVNGSTRSPPKVTKEDNKGNYKKYSDSEDYGMRIITIAGENKGAIMELNPLKKNNDNKNIPQAWSTDSENSKKGYNNDYKPPSSYVNSNVQGVNNSIIFNASCTHHDPGVHLSISRNGNGGRGFHMKEKVIKD